VADLLAPLSNDQASLLRVVSGSFLNEGHWPVWDYVERMAARQRLDAEGLLKSLPFVEGDLLLGRKYGTVWYGRYPLMPDTRIQLTIAASLHLPEYDISVGVPFIRILNVLIDWYDSAPVSASEVNAPTITDAELLGVLPTLGSQLLEQVPELLRFEPPTIGGSEPLSDGGWRKVLASQLLKYRGLGNVRDYVTRITELVEAGAEASAAELVDMLNNSLNNPVLSSLSITLFSRRF